MANMFGESPQNVILECFQGSVDERRCITSKRLETKLAGWSIKKALKCKGS